MVIAAHANGPDGVITETLRMGTSGQSRIAATQQPVAACAGVCQLLHRPRNVHQPWLLQWQDRALRAAHVLHPGLGCAPRAPRAHAAAMPRKAWHRRSLCRGAAAGRHLRCARALLQSQNFDHVRVPKRDQKQWEIDQLRFGAAHRAPGAARRPDGGRAAVARCGGAGECRRRRADRRRVENDGRRGRASRGPIRSASSCAVSSGAGRSRSRTCRWS